MTLRDHLEAVERVTGERPPELDGPECPAGGEYLWSWFTQLRNRQNGGLVGPQRVTWQEADAWSRMTRTDVAPWEIEIIFAVDDLYVAQGEEAAAKRQRQGGGKR